MYKLVLYKYILKLYFVIHKKIDGGEVMFTIYNRNMIFLLYNDV